MRQNSDKSTSSRKNWLWLLLLVLPIAWVKLYEPWHIPRAILRNIEKVTQVELPKHYSQLEIEAATEFCYVGKMRVNHSEMERYLEQMKFTKKPDFLFLSTWGKYKKIFLEPEKLRGFWSATGKINGKYSWEFAYDPETEQMWFVMLQELPAPETDGSP